MKFKKLQRLIAVVRWLKEGLLEESGDKSGLAHHPIPKDQIEILIVLHKSPEQLGPYIPAFQKFIATRKAWTCYARKKILEQYLRALGRAILQYEVVSKRKKVRKVTR